MASYYKEPSQTESDSTEILCFVVSGLLQIFRCYSSAAHPLFVGERAGESVSHRLRIRLSSRNATTDRSLLRHKATGTFRRHAFSLKERARELQPVDRQVHVL